jgi:alpha-amylase
LSDDISLRFNDSSWEGFPLFADQYIDRIAAFPAEEQVINIFMELSALGIAQPLSSNILNFIHALPHFARNKNITFSTPSDICKNFTSVGELDVPDTLSWVDEERDVSSWLGNPMQREAFDKLYSVAERVRICKEPRIMQDWNYLQASNNFRFMTTKPSNVGIDRGIYGSAFDAFTNYMNILGDFMNRVNALYPSDIDDEQLNSLLTTIRNEDEELAMKDREIARLKAKLLKTEAAVDKLRVKYEGKERARKAPKDHTVPQTAEEKTAGNSKK